MFHSFFDEGVILYERAVDGQARRAFRESGFLIFMVVNGGSGVEVSGLDTAAAMTKVQDSCLQWDFPSSDPIGNTVGKVCAVLPLYFSVTPCIEAMPPNEAWAGRSNWVVGGWGIDSSLVGWLEQMGLVSVFPCRV